MDAKISELLAAACPDGLPNPSEPDRERLRALVLDRLRAEGRARRPRLAGRTVLIAAALAALLGVGALAAAAGGLDWLRERVSSGFVGEVEPVEQSVTDEGIELSVIAAQKFGDQAIYYVSLRDVEGLGRVQPGIWQSISAGSSTVAEPVYYDEASGRAVFEVRADGVERADGTAPLEMGELRYDMRELARTPVELELSSLPELSGAEAEALMREPNAEPLCEIPGSEGAHITAAAYCEGELVIRYDETPGDGYSRELQPVLITAEGERLTARGGSRVWSDIYRCTRRNIPVSREELAGGRLYFEGTVCSELYGEWALRVDLGEAAGILERELDISFDGLVLEDGSVTVSPMGVCLSAYGAGGGEIDLGRLPVSLTTEVGELELSSLGSFYYGENLVRGCWPLAAPLDVEGVKALRIGESVIEFK